MFLSELKNIDTLKVVRLEKYNTRETKITFKDGGIAIIDDFAIYVAEAIGVGYPFSSPVRENKPHFVGRGYYVC